MALTNLQKEFINQYFLCNMNGTEAVIQAGYKVKNRQTAAAIASENLRKSRVRGEIDKRLDENTLRANQVLQILTQQALGDVRHVLNKYGEPDFKLALANNATHTIKRWKKRKVITEETTVEEYDIELHDPQSAAVTLGKYHKLFTDRVEVVDWRSEFRNNGLDDAGIFNELVAAIANQQSGD